MNGGRPHLIVISPGETYGRSIPLRRGPIEIGRDPEQALVLHDPGVSGSHAWLEWTGGRVVLGDLNSSNGTWVNGRRIGDLVELVDGDHIRMGSTEFRFSYGAGGGDRIEHHGGIHAGGHVTADRGGRIAGGNIYEEIYYEDDGGLADTVNPFRAVVRGGFGGLLALLGLLLNVGGGAGFLVFGFTLDMDNPPADPLETRTSDILATGLLPDVPLLPASFGAILIGGLIMSLGSAISRGR